MEDILRTYYKCALSAITHKSLGVEAIDIFTCVYRVKMLIHKKTAAVRRTKKRRKTGHRPTLNPLFENRSWAWLTTHCNGAVSTREVECYVKMIKRE
jgi:hypothetical protein